MTGEDMSTSYDSKFFEDMLEGSLKSAEIVLPLVFSEIQPRSIVDVGCGTGAWLSIAKKMNISDVMGLDGSYAKDHLLIHPEEFQSTDISKGFSLKRKYDLAFCLEVAEHIDNSQSAILVDSLTKAADVILFAAALPGQGGNHHVNEQWPDFWKKLFQNNGFVCLDAIRPRIYSNPAVKWWYRQNLYFYIKKQALRNYPRLQAIEHQVDDVLLIHRSLLEKRYGWTNLLKYPFSRIGERMGIRMEKQ